MIALIKEHRNLAIVGGVIMTTWLVCCFATVWRALTDSGDALAKFGQFGDTFGSINALFTGLTLVGLVYTVLQQQKLIQHQEADSLENRKALAREKREVFLTARLNAAVALLQAHEVKGRFSEGWDDAARADARREASKLTHQIGILLCEANLGFEIGDWSAHLEKLAIREYIKLRFEELIYRCDLPPGSLLEFHPRTASREKHDLETLCEVIERRFPGLPRLLNDFVARLMALESKEEAAEQIRGFLNETVAQL